MASLAEPAAKMKWAWNHLYCLDDAIKRFLEPYRNSVITKFDNDTREYQWIFDGDVEEIPVEVTLIVSDILYNMRASLDYLVWQLVLANGATPEAGPGGNSFIIRESKASFDRGKGRALRGVSAKAKARIEELKPYAGGNNSLFWIDELCNTAKHRHLPLVVCSMNTAIGINLNDVDPNFGPVKKGTILATSGVNPEGV